MRKEVLYEGFEDWEKVSQNIYTIMRDYVKNAHLQSLVLGESGGIDSALTSIFARRVCEELGIPFIGRSIAIETNSKEELQRAKKVGELFCHDFKEVNLTDLFHIVAHTMEESEMEEDITTKSYKLRMGNLKARLRMIYLYNLAQRYRGMVLSTDNQTEWLLGFWTLHGDVGDFDPLFGLWKTEVYKLAEYELQQLSTKEEREALKECILCIPTDGLGISSSDVEQFSANNYEEVDSSLQYYLKGEEGGNVNSKVIARHKASEFKRHSPICISREDTFSGDKSRE